MTNGFVSPGSISINWLQGRKSNPLSPGYEPGLIPYQPPAKLIILAIANERFGISPHIDTIRRNLAADATADIDWR